MADLKISQLPNATTPLAGTEVLPIVQGGTTDKVTVANLTAGRAVSASSVELTGGTVNGVAYLNNSKVLTTSSALEFNGSNVLLRGNELIAFNTYDNATLHAGYIRRNTATANMEIAAQTIGANYAINFLTSNVVQVTVAPGGDVTLNTGNLIQGTAAKGFNFTANTGAAGKTSQLLNWYEEGTWTPNDASGAGLTFTSATGKYTRVGRQVTYFAWVTYPSTASGAAAVIGGLPFVAASTDDGHGVTSYNSAGFQMFLRVNATNTIAAVKNDNTTVTNANLTGAVFGFQYTIFV